MAFPLVTFGQTISNTLFDDNALNAKTIDQSKPVGVIDGAGSVTLTGAATYAIPVNCPPGTNGMTPKLTITYSSQAGAGMLGMGWNVDGLSMITRAQKDMYHDGVAAPVAYNNNDGLALDGSRLNLASGSYGQAGSTYRPDEDNFSTITMYDNGANRWFRVVTKDGTQMDYGSTPDSRFLTDDGSEVMMWRLKRVEDVNGNYMEFVYTTWTKPGTSFPITPPVNYPRTSLIDKIIYTGNNNAGLAPYNEIKFNYIQSASPSETYDGGSKLQTFTVVGDIQIKGENSQLIKTYVFNYGHNNINTFLKEVIEKDGNGADLNSTIFKYGQEPANTVAADVLGTVSGNSEHISGDYNGDGISDVVALIRMSDFHSSFTVYKATGNSQFQWLKNVPLPPNTNVTDDGLRKSLNNFLFQAFDFQGDGYEDLLTAQINTNGTSSSNLLTEINVHYGNPDSILCTLPFLFPAVPGHDKVLKNKPFLFPGDFDGDGKTDIITLLGATGNNDFQLFIYRYGQLPSQISGFTWGGFNPSFVPLTWEKMLVIDFDGDGKNELMVFEPNHSYIFTFTKQPNGTFAASLMHSAGYPTNWHKVYPGDFNGDRKTDFLTGTPTGLWEIAISTGKNVSVSTFNFTSPPDFNVDDIVIADYNGDGRTDILHTIQCGSLCEGSAVYYSKGIGFHYEVNPGSKPDMSRLSIGDYNGDGKADLLYRTLSGPAFAVDIVQFKANGKENLLEKVKDGLGRVTSYNYSLLTAGGNFFTQGNAPNSYPLNSPRPGINVISSFSVPNGIGGFNTTNYSYENAILHRAGRGFLGFKKVTSTNATSDIKSESLFNIDPVYYLPYKVDDKTYLASTNQLLSHTTYNVSFQNTIATGFFQKLNSSTEYNALTGATNTTSNTYNANGSITQSVVNVNGVESTTVNTVYTTTANGIEKPLTISTAKWRTGNVVVMDRTAFSYDALGRLSSKTDFHNKGLQVFTTYGYGNPFGNITSETVTGTNIPYSAITSDTYDSKGRFIVSTTNPLNQTSTATWDTRWGKPLEITGIDNVRTTNVYDSWGKLTSSVVKYWTSVGAYTISYQDGWDLANGIWYTKVIHPGKPDVKTWFDILGREIKTETEHLNSQYLYATNAFNAKGQLVSSVKPHLLSETAITTTNTYNAYGLLATSSNVYGTTTTTYSYGNGKTTTTVSNPKGQTTTVTDAAGRVLEQTDNGGKLSFTYDSRGNVLAIKQGVVTLIANTYDTYGRKISVNDCDAGLTTYTYDAWGRLTSEKDAKNNTYSFTYDNVDRLTQRTGPEGTTTYQYYGAGNGYANQLSSVTGFNGVDEEYDYDQFGRMSYKKTTVDGQDFETHMAYNYYGDLVSVNYHSGFGYQNSYDPNGFLRQVVTSWSGFPYYSSETLFDAGTVNGNGQYTSYTLGNGLTTTKTYDNGFPLNTTTPGIQNLTTNFNIQTGNLASRWDYIKNMKEDFTYDNLNRLTSSTVSFFGSPMSVAPAITMSYDQSGTISQGNITSKTDVGSYKYGGFPRHALKYTDNSSLNVSKWTQSITYTPFQKTQKVTETDNLSTHNFEQVFTYDAFYERIKSELTENGNQLQTRYYLDGYEYNAIGNNYVYYVPGGDGICAIIEHCPSIYAPSKAVHYVYKDHLGSILTATDANGNIEAEQNFDAWGRFRDPDNWSYNYSPLGLPWLYRGYTGHEHMPEFGLINMNGRMYDPLLGRMLAPDNYTYGGSQGYNRFSYCFNNPLNCVDPSGEFFFILPMASYDAKSGLDVDVTFGVGWAGGAGVFGSVGYSSSNNNWRFGVGAYAGIFTASVNWGTQTGWSAYAGVGMFGFGSGMSSNITGAGIGWSEHSGVSVSALGFTYSSYGLSAGMTLSYGQALTISKERAPVLLACNDCGDYASHHLPEVVFKAEANTSWIGNVQLALDGVGMTEIPVLSQAAELVSAGISAYNGDWTGAAIGLGSMIPVGGKVFEGMKVARAAAKIGQDAHAALRLKVKAKGGRWLSEPRLQGKNGRYYRPDVVTPSGNFIELKPNTISGRIKGWHQANTYRKQLGMHGRVVYYNP